MLKARILTWEDPAPAQAPQPVVQRPIRPDGTRPTVFFSCSCKLSDFMERARQAQQTLSPPQ